MLKNITVIGFTFLTLFLAGSASADLVAHYDFEEGSGTAVADVTSNQVNGTLDATYPPGWTSDAALGDYALDLSAGDSNLTNVYCGNFDPTGADGSFSVTLWAKWLGSEQWWEGSKYEGRAHVLFEKIDTDSPTDMMFKCFQPAAGGEWDGDEVWTWTNGGIQRPDVGVNENQWTFVAISYDGVAEEITTSVNGGEVEETISWTPGTDTAADVFLGISPYSGTNWGTYSYNGYLDDVRFYDKALSAEELKVMFEGPEPNLVAHYEFEEGSGTAIADSTTNNYDGTFDATYPPAWTAGKLGNYALDLTASDNVHATLGTWNPSNDEGSFSVALWCYWVNTNTLGTLLQKQDSKSTSDMMWNIFLTDGYRSNNSIALWQPASASTFRQGISPNQWVHLGITYKGTTGTATCYVNADWVSTTAFTPGTDTAAAVNLGDQGSTFPTFDGYIDDVRFYDGALSQYEMRLIMGKCYPNYSGDINNDCYVNFPDYVNLAGQWLD